MELFHEMKNRYVLGVIKVINHLHKTKEISGKKFRAILEEEGISFDWAEYLVSIEPFVRYSACGKEKSRDDSYLEDDDIISLSMPDNDELGEIPIRPSILEKTWLKSALQNKYMPLFLETKEIETLKKAVADAPDIDQLQVQKSFALYPDQMTIEFKSNFRLLLQAISENRFVSFTNHTPNGSFISSNVLPFKIEYSIDEEVFRFVFYHQRENRPVKANIARLSDISLGDCAEAADSKVLKDLVEERIVPDPLELRVRKKHNSPERAFFLFANYECDRAWKDDEKGEFLEFKIRYHTFEEKDLISLILTLGPNAEVISPTHVRDKIIDKLRESV